MRDSLCIKAIVIGIILLFVGASNLSAETIVGQAPLNTSNNIEYEHRYAVIVKGPSGSAYLYRCYTNDVQRGYNALHYNHSFPDEDIHVIFTEEGYPPHETFDPTIIDYESTETNLIDVLNMFKPGGENEMGYNDLLFLFWIGHGGNSDGHTFFPLHVGDVWDYEFAQYAEGILGTTVFVFQPCHSGGFVKEVSAPLRIVITSVNEWEGEGGWAGTFWNGLTGKADEDPEIGNQDGLVSFEEAYHLPARYVYEREGKHSLLDDNADSVGHHYLDGGYNISDPLKDAYTAARAFFTHRGLAAYIEGPCYGLTDVELEFNGIAIAGEPPYDYYWDFGDGETSEGQNPKHIYTSSGEYIVNLTITDDSGESSHYTTSIWIQETNDPPEEPIITGETSGRPGESYDYNFASTDPEGAIIWYYIDWGDGTNTGWFGPYDSDETITKSHEWSETGTYEIKAKTKDPYDAESDWGTLTVIMPRNRIVNRPFLNFLENHPILFQILQRFLNP